MERITEKNSEYSNLEKSTVCDLLKNINNEDKKVAFAVEKSIKSIEKLTNAALKQLKKGGRVFYIGSGTSGRLGIVDASECPPTFGVDHNTVIGIIAGGDNAIRKAVEFAEDDVNAGWEQLKQHNITSNDFVIGLSASGYTPYVIGAIQNCAKNKIKTGCVTSNAGSLLARECDYAIEVIVGPEFVTGSTRMKSGTALKLVLNMISTSIMIKLGRIKGNKMVDMQPLNNKLLERGANIIVSMYGVDFEKARKMLVDLGSVRAVINLYENNKKK